MAFIISSVSMLRKLPTFLVLASVLIFNGCNFEDLDDSEEPTTPETSFSAVRKNCESIKTPGECRSQGSCQYFNSWRTPTKGKCLAKASANKLSCGKLTKDDCELNSLGTEKCVFAGICQPESGFSAKGFSKLNSFHLNGTKENDRGFNSAGLNVKTGSKYDALGMDIDGRNSRGFDAKGLLATGLDRDSRGFDAKGIHTNGTDRDDRHFDVKGLLIGGADRDARGFDAAGLLADGSDRDSRGFDAAGLHSNGTQRDDRGFDIQGRLLGGADRDRRGFDAQGLHTNGSDRDNRGFNLAGRHSNGTDRDDRDFDLRGLLPNFALRDARGFDADGLLWDLSDRDNRGFNARGLHTNNTDRDDRGFDIHGLLVGNLARDPRGFNADGFLPDGTDKDARGFKANRRLACGSLVDVNGFDVYGNHQTTGGLYNPGGFDMRGIHRDTGTEYSSADPTGVNIDGENRQEARIRSLGPCSIPGPGDNALRDDLRTGILYWPAPPYADREAFLMAIEDKCKEFMTPVALTPGESLTQKRTDLIQQVQTDVGLGAIQEINYQDTDRNTAFRSYIVNLSGINRNKKAASVSYLGEAGIDAGGLTKEFRNLIAEKMVPMFKDGMTIKENFDVGPDAVFTNFSQCTAVGEAENKENCWKNIGRAFAKLSFIEGGTFRGDANRSYPYAGVPYIKLSPALIHGILGTPMDNLVNLLAILLLEDEQYFKSIMQMLAMSDADIVDILDLQMGDETGLEQAGVPDPTPITGANILAYTQAKIHKKFNQEGSRWFIEGFRDIIPLFPPLTTPKSLSLMLEGGPTTLDSVEPLIDVRDRLNRADAAHPYKTWFLEIIREKMGEDPAFLSKLLKFWTGSPMPPTGGSRLELRIELNDPTALPQSHTCFDQLDIPAYPDKATFKAKLIQAIENTAGFGMS